MRERKYVKFRVDMYEDTKFKIIDMKPERDVIHYIWSRLVLLAGKVNLEGDLYLSKSIPYTVETLSIELNREIAQVKSALDLFIELEMLELTEDKIFRVKNFTKHQNIKVKPKEKNIEVDINASQVESLKAAVTDHKDEDSQNGAIVNTAENSTAVKAENNIEEDKSRDNLQGNNPIELNFKKRKRRNKKQDIEDFIVWGTDEESQDDSNDGFHEGMPAIFEGALPYDKDKSGPCTFLFVDNRVKD